MAKPNSTGLLDTTLNQLCKKGLLQVVYDIGANKGAWTSAYAPRMPFAEFHMFEANPAIEQPSNRGAWHKVALSDRSDEKRDFFVSTLFEGAGNSFYRENSQLYSGQKQSIELATKTLDEYVKTTGIATPDFIKIDTQGSELDILRGATACLHGCVAMMSEVPVVRYNKGAPELPDYIRFMKKSNFLPIGIEEVHVLDNILVQVDIVFVKDAHYKSSLSPINPIGWQLELDWD